MSGISSRIPAFLIIFLVVILVCAAFAYREARYQSSVEVNGLRTPDAAVVHGVSEGEIDALMSSEARLWITWTNEETGILILAAKDYARVPLPLSKGEGFDGSSKLQLVLGISEKEYALLKDEPIEFIGERYELVGALGHRDGSPLHGTAVAKYVRGTHSVSSTVVVSGDRAYERCDELGLNPERFNSGHDAYSNKDPLSGALVISMTLASILALYFAGIANARSVAVLLRARRILGYSTKRQIAVYAGELAAFSLGAMCMALLILSASSATVDHGIEEVIASCFVILLPAFSCSVECWQILKEA